MLDAPKTGFTVDQDVMVRMRDGVQLATDVYHPAGAGPWPVLMERTPYGKSRQSRSEKSLDQQKSATRAEVAAFFSAQGYVVVMQDCRGRYRSGGTFTKYLNEAGDGYDTLQWLLEQSWCNGKVGTMGLSYGAHTQLALACLNPSGLACMFMDSGGFSSAYHGGIRQGGAFELKQATWAFRHALVSQETQDDPARKSALQNTDIVEWFRNMPWRPGHSPLSVAPEYEETLFRQWREGCFSDYWRQPGLWAEGFYEQIPDIPIAIVGSWYDPYVLTCTSNFMHLSSLKQSRVQLLMGPWTHGNRSQTWAGDVDFGPASTLDDNIADSYLDYRLDWFNRWLKPGHAEQVESPRVRYFQMGGGDGSRDRDGRLQHGGRWMGEDNWPPTGTTNLPLYLHPSGELTSREPAAEDSFIEYVYDPENPVPTIGGAVTSGEPVMAGGAYDQRVTPAVFCYRDTPVGYALSERADVLVFETGPLENDVVVSGAMSAELWVSSDCPDTDFTVKLVDVYPPSKQWPEGFAMNITDGIFRVRYREGWDREVFMQPGEVYPVSIKPFATSNLFKKGHRLRIDISSSNYPHFDLNPNTGEAEGRASGFRVAANRIHCSRQYPSHVILPVLRSPEPGDEWD